MSLLQTAFLERSRVPDRATLEQAVRTLGFDLSIDEYYRPFDCSGFLPCMLNGKKSGFEIYFGAPEQEFQQFPHLRQQVESRDCTITFRWGGDMRECACVLIVSAALATTFDAIVHYQDDDLVYTSGQLVEQAKEAIKYADEEEATSSRDTGSPPPPGKPWWKFW